MKLSSPEAYQLIHDGALALADVEANGIRIDVDLLDQKIKKTTRRIKKLKERLQEQDLWKQWKREFGTKAKLGSREQLSWILFEKMDYEYPGEPTKDRKGKNKYKADEEILATVKHVFVKNYLRLAKLEKVNGTYLKGIRRHVAPSGFLHPAFNLHFAVTWRSSSSDPNFQNLPIRSPEFGKEIRECFVARDDDHVLVEIDYSGIEVRIAAAYHQDPVMLEYIHDKTKDMHRDMAAECYKCKPEQVSKEMRYCAKNQFVFPEFYGSYFVQCAPNLWASIEKMDLGMPVKCPKCEGVGFKGKRECPKCKGEKKVKLLLDEWLAKKGIKGLGEMVSDRATDRIRTQPGTFYEHIRKVEENFWGQRFKVYAKWKESWWKKYQERGWFRMKTGFVSRGVYAKNQVINSPVQGAAFHCLLWSLIRLNKWVKKNLKQSYIVGQIHDSMIGDIHVKELDDYLTGAKRIMTEELVKAWKWINVPIEIEVEVTPPGGNWYQKKEIKL